MVKLPFVPTYSSLAKFQLCPRQYWDSYVRDEKRPFVQSPAGMFGDYVHKFMEQCVNARRVPPQEAIAALAAKAPESDKGDALPHLQSVAELLRGLVHQGNPRMLVEEPVAVLFDNGKYQPAAYSNKNSLVRANIDLLARTDNGGLQLFDLKSGSTPRDTFQIEIYAAAAVIANDGEPVAARYWMTGKIGGGTTDTITVTEREVPTIMNTVIGIRETIGEYHQRFGKAMWPATRNNLCKSWCPVTECEHNGSALGGRL